MNSSTNEETLTVGLVGFGEAGQAIAKSLRKEKSINICAFDKNFCSEISIKKQYTKTKIKLLNNPKKLAEKANIIISVVTAEQSANAAKKISKHLNKNHIYLDGNSVSPGTKIKTNKIIKFSGATYYDLAIMAPIHPLGHKTKMLVAGSNNTKIKKILKKLKFNYKWESSEIGKAAVVKMLRSIMIKGVESLLTECITASEKIGIHDRILLSAEKTLGIKNIKKLADYFMERSALHGLRRSDEMNEVVKTLKEMKLSSHMSKAISIHQKMIGKLTLRKKFKNKIPQDRIKIARAIRKV